jgi:hypothetical protein
MSVTPLSGHHIQQQDPQQAVPSALGDPFRPFSPPLDLSVPGFPSLPDFQMSGTGEVQPLDFVRALESGFMERNWHEGWWDMDGDINVGLGGMDT